MKYDWKKVSVVGWICGIGSIGFFLYGIYCIVMKSGYLFVPFHSMEMGSPSDGLAVQGTAAVRTGIAYILFSGFMASSFLWNAHVDQTEKWARNNFFLFIAAVICLLWAMFSM